MDEINRAEEAVIASQKQIIKQLLDTVIAQRAIARESELREKRSQSYIALLHARLNAVARVINSPLAS